jgi:copper chaperone CopZ
MRKALFIPAAIAIMIAIAYGTTNMYRVPTVDIRFASSRPENVSTVVYEVAGLKCRGTSNMFAQQIREVPGVVSLVSYARTHTAIVEYDPALTDPQAIRRAFEAPIVVEGTSYDVFRAISVEPR